MLCLHLIRVHRPVNVDQLGFILAWLLQQLTPRLHAGGKLCQLVVWLTFLEVVSKVVLIGLVQVEPDLVFRVLALEEEVA